MRSGKCPGGEGGGDRIFWPLDHVLALYSYSLRTILDEKWYGYGGIGRTMFDAPAYPGLCDL